MFAKQWPCLQRIPFRLIGLGLLAYILYAVDLARVAVQLKQVGVVPVVMAIGCFLMLLILRCVRWHLLLKVIGVERPALESIVSCNKSIWYGLVTPGRFGEFSRAVDLRRHTGKSLAETSALVVFDLLLDLFTYAVLSGAGALLLFVHNPGGTNQTLYALCLAASFAGLGVMRWPIATALHWMPWLRQIPGFSILLPSLADGLRGALSWTIALLTWGTTLAYVLMMAALITPMQLNLGATDYLTTVGVAGLSGALPITYFGFGTREIALIWQFAHLGLSAETAVAVSFTFVIAQIIGIAVSLVVGLILRGSQRLST